jgi:hypothetical protein
VAGVIGPIDASAYDLVIDQAEVAEMLTGEMARYQIQDRVREAEQARLASSTRVRRPIARSAAVRSVGSGLMVVAAALRRRSTPTAVPVSLKPV